MKIKYKIQDPPTIVDTKIIVTWNNGSTETLLSGNNDALNVFLESAEEYEKETYWNLCEGCFDYVHVDYTVSDDQPFCPTCTTSNCCGAEIAEEQMLCKKCKEHV
jgi:hypothetical protein|tara:strand:+ start:2808 stop:3122 length:315 start_codon:yes stop_codon:yes gene_type:complete